MGALPRPGTPGLFTATFDEMERGVVYDTRNEGVAYISDPADTEAFAALPERIAREDRVREVCERTVSSKLDTSEARVEAALARDILRILDGEEGA